MNALTLRELAPMMREAMRDKSYQQATGLGDDVARYLRWKGISCAENTLLAYESTLAAFCWHYAELELRDFEPPIGTERVEEFLHAHWRGAKPSTYNRHRAALKDFFDEHRLRGRMFGDPMLVVKRARKREVFREVFSEDQARMIVASAENARDRVALRLLLHYALRRDGLRLIQMKHFDHVRRRVAVQLKRGKVRYLRIPEGSFWHDLERFILDAQLEPHHYLMHARWDKPGRSPERPLSAKGLHNWWYRMLAQAGVVVEGTTSGERMHKARHTAGQVVLDRTGNLSAAKGLLMHDSIQTTGDIYTDWDDERLAATLRTIYEEDEL